MKLDIEERLMLWARARTGLTLDELYAWSPLRFRRSAARALRKLLTCSR